MRFDAATLQQTAVRDLLPSPPEVPKDAEASDELIKAMTANRAQRLATALLIPQGNDLGVVVGNGYFLLDGATLEVKAQQAPGDASAGAANTIQQHRPQLPG